MVPAYHGDQKSCSTRREISSPAKELGITFRPGIGIAYVTTIQNRHSERSVGRWFRRIPFWGRNTAPEPVPFDRTGISVRTGVGTAHEAPIQNRHFDLVGKRSHSEISGAAQNSSPGARSRAVDAIAYRHLFAQTSITFHS
ncbi:hypothetical protein Taro_020030, partial [Colocasia esculenta]|nr:hypothetical protein [Colocasia esculenta]